MNADLDLRDRVLSYIRAHPGSDGADIAEALGADMRRTFAAIDALLAEGAIER